MKVKKVSIITPCFNGGKFLDRYFSGILAQTYRFLEVIIVDDGSTDNTRQKCEEYQSELDAAWIEFKYLYKENGGPASAINKGLKIFTGEYITWPDCDDWLLPESIEARVRFLEKNPGYGGVRTDGYQVNEDNLWLLDKRFSDYYVTEEENIFEELVLLRTFIACDAYLFQSKALKECVPNLQVNEKLHGQNWQLMLPICYKYNVGYINRPLFVYLVRKDSLSHQNAHQGYKEKTRMINEYEKTVTTVLGEMADVDKKHIVEQLRVKYKYQRMLVNIKFHKIMAQNERIFREKIVIWGTGEAAKQIIGVLSESSLSENILYFVDNDSQKWGGNFESYNIISPKDLLKKAKDKEEKVFIIVASSYYLKIRKQLLEYGYKEWDDFIDGMGFLL